MSSTTRRLTMYPDWPESDEDLIPLPECPGPKLKPFDFQGPQNIEFLEIAGEGLHAMVFKVRILGNIYALKVFRWVWDLNWIGPGRCVDHRNREQMSAFYDYQEPFSAECRAFGRLQETGNEDLAVPCFGYVLLDEESERAMNAQCNLNYWTFNGDIDFAGDRDEEMNQRQRFLGKNGRYPPLRCIVKAFGHAIPCAREDTFQQTTARRLLRDLIKLQKLGIMQIDVGIRQVIDGKFGDFSTAITMPHFITSPELNPNLTLPAIDQIKKLTFQHCVNDYLDFDSMITEWNEWFGEKKGFMTIFAYPGGRGIGHGMRYDLRSGAKTVKQPLYSFVNPTKYGWTASPANQRDEISYRRRSGRISKKVKRQARQRLSLKPQPRKLTARPDMWHWNYEDQDAGWAGYVRWHIITIDHYVQWGYRDGHIVPALGSDGKELT